MVYIAAPDASFKTDADNNVRLVRYDMKVKLTDFLTITSQDDSGMKTIELHKCKQRSQNCEVEKSAKAFCVFKSHLHCGIKYEPNLPFYAELGCKL